MTPPNQVRFADLGLDPRLVSALDALGFETATPIQQAALPVLLDGRDVVGRARTGSGKTAAFGLPIVQRHRDASAPCRALVLAPTRELALQVSEAISSFAQDVPLTLATVYGGAPYGPQTRALDKAAVVVGTPGRVLDHLKRGSLDLSMLETFVLDEADEMLRMGFIDDVTELLDATPPERQIALFSATMPDPIRAIAERHLRDPVEVQVEERALTVDHIEQHWIRVPRQHRLDALMRVLRGVDRDATLVFARTRIDCAEVADALAKRGVAADALHGDLNQAARERVLGRLRARALDVVVATDVAARGIDVDHISHVIQLELPPDAETYVHRIGRTGRVGRRGVAITFATPKEKKYVAELERRLRTTIAYMDVPSDADVARRERGRLKDRLAEVLDRAREASAQAWLTELQAESGWSTDEIAAAALHLLARSLGGNLESSADDTPPDWARRPSERAPRGEDTNEVELFFPIGRWDNVRPADFVGALANEGGIAGERIGRVNIFDRKTFVGVPAEVAQTLLAALPRLEIRGHDVPLVLANPRDPEDAIRPRGERGRGRGRGRGGFRGRGEGFGEEGPPVERDRPTRGDGFEPEGFGDEGPPRRGGRGRGMSRGRGRGDGPFRGPSRGRGRGGPRGRGGRGRGRG